MLKHNNTRINYREGRPTAKSSTLDHTNVRARSWQLVTAACVSQKLLNKIYKARFGVLAEVVLRYTFHSSQQCFKQTECNNSTRQSISKKLTQRSYGNTPDFMETKCSSTCSQQPATGLHYEFDVLGVNITSFCLINIVQRQTQNLQ